MIRMEKTINNCYIGGCVLNCAPYLDKVFENIALIGQSFDKYKIIISYDHSSDNSLEIINRYKSTLPIEIIINQNPVTDIREQNIANARNKILDWIRNDNDDSYNYFIMIDMDDVSEPLIQENLYVIGDYLRRDDWDALSFNRVVYYDLFALSIVPYIFSNWKNVNVYENLFQFIKKRIAGLKPDQLLVCHSAFNGFAIYRKNIFIHCHYSCDIKDSIDLVDPFLLDKNMKFANINENLYLTSQDDSVDCEHRSFHLQAIRDYGARIRISPYMLFV